MIPKILLQISKDPYPQYIKDMWQERIDQSWTIDWFDDEKIMQFFDNNPLPEFPNIKQVFWSFEAGAHRADLFRYYYLYLNGGIFVDSDAMVYIHLNELIKPEIEYFFPISIGDIRGTLPVGEFKSAIFNGFFGCIKNSDVLYHLLRDAYLTQPSELKHYLRFMCMMEERVKHENPPNAVYFKFDHNDNGTEGFVYDNSGEMICKHYHYTKIVPPDPIKANPMKQFEKKVYSQNGEDGIIEHIFNAIGTTSKIAVEIGVSAGEDGSENNTMHLATQGWNTYWFDCLDNNSVPDNCIFTKQILTADNVVKTFESLDIPKDIDLLSIDIDGNDYYIREELSEYRPRVCIMEYNGCFDGKEEYIMPRNDNYFWPGGEDRTFGASLKSYTKQAERLGYDLVYCDSKGVNAFFVRKDINVFPALTSEKAWVKLWWAHQMNRKEHIQHLYRVILGREPDYNGLNNYLNSNLDLYQIQLCLWQSDEFKSRFNNIGFIETTSLDNKLPIFIVNLERRPDRKRLIESRLANLGIKNYEIIKAVDGRELPENLDQVYDKESAMALCVDLSRAEIATALSHIEIAKKIIKQNLDYAVILEDDVELTIDFKNLVKDFNLEKDKFDFLLLGWSSSNEFFNGKIKKIVAPYNAVNKNGSVSYLDKTEFNIGSIGIHKPFYPSLHLDYINGAYGYVMSNAGARKLLEFNYPVRTVTDHVNVYHIDKVKTLFTTSMIVHTQTEDSDIAFERNKNAKDFSNSFYSRINCPDYGT
jgi:GR25 family glycosyltransferase involved in LPS biosynthesis